MRPDPKLEVSVFLEVEMEEVEKNLEFTLQDADRLSEEVKFLTPRYRSMVTALAAAAYHRNSGSAPEAGDDDDAAEVLITVEDGDDLPPVGEVIRHGFVAGKRLGLAGQDEGPDEGMKIGGRQEMTKIGTKIGTRIVIKRRPEPNE